MWNSLGKATQNWVLEQSKFTGFLGEGYDSIDILSIAKLDFILGSVLDCIDNRIFKGGEEDPDVVYTVAYSKPMVGEDGEDGALHHLLPELALCILQPVHHLVVALQGLDEHAVLYGLGEHTLHLTVGGAHIAR